MAVAPSDSRRQTQVESIALWGNRAVVTCIVTIGNMRYHNVRLFIRQDQAWKILGWANEPL
jgi:hypothetical protein